MQKSAFSTADPDPSPCSFKTNRSYYEIVQKWQGLLHFLTKKNTFKNMFFKRLWPLVTGWLAAVVGVIPLLRQ